MTRKSSTLRASGFTIVELLVVIIVIAILATLTIVSYSAVTNNAKKQSAKTDAQTAATVLNKYKAEHGAFPADMATLGTVNNVKSTFQYSYNNTTDTFCLTASVTGASAYVTSSNTEAKDGGCPGHGVNGQTPITNLAYNPSSEASNAGVSGYFSSPVSRVSGGAVDRTWSFSTTTNSTTNTQGLIHTVTTSAKQNQAYTCSMSFKGTPGAIISFGGRPATAADGYINENLGAQSVTLSSSWQRLNITFTTPATTGILRVQYRLTVAASGVTIQSDALICTEGSTVYQYADGETANWAWTGTPDASTSTGPAL